MQLAHILAHWNIDGGRKCKYFKTDSASRAALFSFLF